MLRSCTFLTAKSRTWVPAGPLGRLMVQGSSMRSSHSLTAGRITHYQSGMVTSGLPSVVQRQQPVQPSPVGTHKYSTQVNTSVGQTNVIYQGKATTPDGEYQTPLYDFHVSHGGRMVPYAGYSMPVQYEGLGILASHQHTRQAASLFDVSHMLQVRFTGKDRVRFLESLVVADLQNLPAGQMTLSVLTNDQGGIIDDTVITNQPRWFESEEADGALYMVLNAGCAVKDLAHLQKHLQVAQQQQGWEVELELLTDYALLALQGPQAVRVVQSLVNEAEADAIGQLKFMHSRMVTLKDGAEVHLARCGYTGEDGFEISVPATRAVPLAQRLLEDEAVELAGLGARDSLRLEAGLCLYGHELGEDITPVEAGLTWTIGKRRRQSATEAGFPGASTILEQIKTGPPRRRVGITFKGAPARENSVLYDENENEIGKVTSGIPSPTTPGHNIAMGYVLNGHHKKGTSLLVGVRRKKYPAQVVKLPFVPANYFKG
ncbi:hypothetical protein IWQ62_000866 [Dispira parvispora]|uniref:Aminomethyltransferase n=1 Tax=Dispira parvispora TaxID=1520584 RepID=A0A9W8E9Q5_9FUNG|nr:hypothetical protein IWQ62_000866 [Dispira parvispora]